MGELPGPVPAHPPRLSHRRHSAHSSHLQLLLRRQGDRAGAERGSGHAGRSHVGVRWLLPGGQGHLRRARPPHGGDQLEHRSGRRLGMGGEPVLPASVLDLRLPDGREFHHLRNESLMPSWFESVFEFLFKYRPLLYDRGELSLGVSWPVVVAGVAGVAIAVPTLLRYRAIQGKASSRDRLVLTGLRVAILLLVVFCLFRPSLVLSTVVPQRSFVGILLDDSRSMQIADVGGKARGAFIQETFGPEGSALAEALSEKFMLRFFRFSDSADRLSDPGSLGFTGPSTHLARALERSVSELSNVPLAGIVLVSDGADNSTDAISDTLLDLQARKVPVHTVGLGRE